jgi:hypothetical protein
MKTAEQYINDFQENSVSSTGLSNEAKIKLINIVRQAQAEAWSEATQKVININGVTLD